MEQPGLEPAPIQDAGAAGRGLAYCATVQAPEEAPGSWLGIGPDLANGAIGGMSQQLEDLSLSLSLSVTLPFK